VVSCLHGGSHTDEAVSLKQLRVEYANAAKSGILALFYEVGHHWAGFAGRNSQVYLDGHCSLLMFVPSAERGLG
jgi:hypothetical protein